jgi:hypothetical protein
MEGSEYVSKNQVRSNPSRLVVREREASSKGEGNRR